MLQRSADCSLGTKNYMNLKEKIEARQALFDQGNEADALADDIRKYLRQNRGQLPLEDIIEALTHLGECPSVLYDDNGHFFIGGDGAQNLPTLGDDWQTKETFFTGDWIVPPGGWKKTIREALDAYLDK